ncbi:MAG: hypothetical protein IPL49_17025 [Saprospirales bacterium]|nr:hypothetical protein [Saprospirales bacterium]
MNRLLFTFPDMAMWRPRPSTNWLLATPGFARPLLHGRWVLTGLPTGYHFYPFTQNKAQVIVIADACHAGKLAGTRLGYRATAPNLSQQFANEVKVLSCQPNEFSLEGEQWGGGRGCFPATL